MRTFYSRLKFALAITTSSAINAAGSPTAYCSSGCVATSLISTTRVPACGSTACLATALSTTRTVRLFWCIRATVVCTNFLSLLEQFSHAPLIWTPALQRQRVQESRNGESGYTGKVFEQAGIGKRDVAITKAGREAPEASTAGNHSCDHGCSK
jgi:hypothetical protein